MLLYEIAGCVQAAENLAAARALLLETLIEVLNSLFRFVFDAVERVHLTSVGVVE